MLFKTTIYLRDPLPTPFVLLEIMGDLSSVLQIIVLNIARGVPLTEATFVSKEL